MSQTRGGEGQIVVRKVSKRSKLILGAAVASALAGMTASAVRATDYSWNGSANTFWDNAGNWTPNTGFPTFGDNANFGNGSALSVDLHAITQNANSANFTNTTGGYLLSNGSLSVVSISQSGNAVNTIGSQLILGGSGSAVTAGTLSLTNLSGNSNNLSGQSITVGSGATLSAAGGYGAFNSAVHQGTVALNGGTFSANGILNGQNALLASYYDTGISDTDQIQGTGRFAPDLHTGNGILTLTPTGTNALTKSINFDIPGQNGGVPGGEAATNILAYSGGLLTNPNNFATTWTGVMHVSAADAAGGWIFGTRSDDNTVIWIDLNHDHHFTNAADATNELIVNNNFFQGANGSERTNFSAGGNPGSGTTPLSLAAGDYDILVGFGQGIGGAEAQAAFINTATHPGNPAAFSGYTLINPGDPTQSGMWSSAAAAGFKYDANYSTTPVTVAASTTSAIDLSNALSATFADVTVNPSATLNINGTITGGNWSLDTSSHVVNTGSIRAIGSIIMGNSSTMTSGSTITAAGNISLGTTASLIASGNISAAGSISIGSGSTVTGSSRVTASNLTMADGSTLNANGTTGISAFGNSQLTGNITISTAHTVSTGPNFGGITQLTKKGPGLLAINDAGGMGVGFAPGSTIHVQQGALSSRSDGGSNTTNAQTISLEGGTFSVQGPSGVDGFNVSAFVGGNQQASLDPISNIMGRTPAGTGRQTVATMSDRGAIVFDGVTEDNVQLYGVAAAAGSTTGADNYSVLWTTQISIKPGQGGRYIFSSSSDDAGIMWIDLNHNGVFEYSTDPLQNELIVQNNNGAQGRTRRDNNDPTQYLGHSGHPNLDLAPGNYQVAMGSFEGGGDANASFTVNGPATNGVEQYLNGNLQPGLWRVLDPFGSDANYTQSNVVVTQDSAIDVFANNANFGTLVVNAGKTLSITGLGNAKFTSTTGSGGNLLLNTGQSDQGGAGLSTGQIINGGGLTGITKSGIGTLTIDESNFASGLGIGSNVNVTAGKLVVAGDVSPGFNPLGSASVTLANGTSALLSSKTFAAAGMVYDNPISASGTVRVTAGAGGSGGVTTGGAVTVSTLNLASGTTLNTGSTNSYNLTFTQTTAAGNATINNSGNTGTGTSLPVTFKHITGAGSSVLTFNGADTSVIGNVTANNVVINNRLTIDPARGSGVSNITSNAQVNNRLIVASGVTDFGSGTITGVAPHLVAGLQEIFYSSAGGDGFYEGPLNRAVDNIDNIARSYQLGPRRANQAVGNTSGTINGPGTAGEGWRDNSTYAYWGQIFVPDNAIAGDAINGTTSDGVGSIAFAIRFDDSTLLKIDGNLVMRDGNWDNTTSSGRLNLTTGWHDIEMRFGEGTGGVGPNSTAAATVAPIAPVWTPSFADGTPASFGIQVDPSLGFDPSSGTQADSGSHATQAKYIAARDNGTMNLFRSFDPNAAGDIDIAATAELRAGGVNALNSINMGTNQPGGQTNTTFTLASHATQSNSDVDNLNIRTNFGTDVDHRSSATVNIGANTTLTARAFNLDADLDSAGYMIKTGAGTLAISTNTILAGGSIDINGGRLEFNGTGPLSAAQVKANAGGTLGGSGHVPSDAVILANGHLAPHTSATGVAKLSVDGQLALNDNSQLDFNFGLTGDSVDAFTLNITGNPKLNIFDVPGFGPGTYRLFDMTNFGDPDPDPTHPSNIQFGTNTFNLAHPGIFTYAITETNPTGSARGHIDLVVAAKVLKWDGTFDNNWFIGGAPATANWKNNLNNADVYIDLVSTVFDDTASGSHNVNISEAAGVSPASILVDTTTGYTIGGNPINGATGITKRGTGTLTVTNTNSYIGAVNVENGTLNVNSLANGGSNSALGAGVSPISLGSASTSGTLLYSGAVAATTNRGLTLNAGGGVLNIGANNVGVGGVVTGAGGITKIGAGTLTLSNTANTNTGSILMDQGTVSVASMGVGAVGTTIGLGSGVNAGTFEYSGPTQTGNRGLIIPSAGGTVRVTVGPVGNTPAANLTLNGPVSGPTLTKAGLGTLTLGGPVAFTGTSHSMAANSGTLAYATTGSPNSISGNYDVAAGSTLASNPGGLGTATVNLNGGTFRTTGGGLTATLYNMGVANDNGNNGWTKLDTLGNFRTQLATGTPIATVNTTLADRDIAPQGGINNSGNRGAMHRDGTNNSPWSQYAPTGSAADQFPGANNDNIVSRYVGKIYISPDLLNGQPNGDFVFVTASDDGSALWIDGDAGTDAGHVVRNNFFQGITASTGTDVGQGGNNRSTIINLTPGWHDIEVGYYEGGGGAGLRVAWAPPNRAVTVLPNSVLAPVQLATPDFTATNVNVVAGSSSKIEHFGIGKIGTLSLGAGSTLGVTGTLTATGTTLVPGTGTYTVNTEQGARAGAGSLTDPPSEGVNLGILSGTGTFVKTGGGIVSLESDATATRLGAGSIINVNAGDLTGNGGGTKASPFGAATINLANGGGLILGSTNGSYTFNNTINTTGTVRLQSRPFGAGVLGAARNTGTFLPLDPAPNQFGPENSITMTVGGPSNPLTLAAGSTVQMTRSDANRIRLANVVLKGNGTLNNQNTSFGVTVANVSPDTGVTGNTLTFNGGGNRTRITGTITAGTITIDNSNATNTLGILTGGGVYSEPDAGPTGTTTLNGTVRVLSQLDSNFGTLSTSGVIRGQRLIATQGIRERFLTGGFNTTIPAPAANPPVADSIQPTLRRGNQARVNTTGTFDPASGWQDNTTYQYLGQIFVPDNAIAGDATNGSDRDGIGSVAFAESFDDSVLVRVDATNYINNGTWNNSTSSGRINLSVGWHDIDIRFGQGGGGVGPGNGVLAGGASVTPAAGGPGTDWPAQFPAGSLSPGKFTSLVYQTDPNLGFDANSGTNGAGGYAGATLSKYFTPEGGGVFRVVSQTGAGTLNIAQKAAVNTAGLEDMIRINLSATGTSWNTQLIQANANSPIPNIAAITGAATSNLNISSPTTHVGHADQMYAGGDTGQVNTVTLGANNTLDVNVLNVFPGTIFNKNGPGTLIVSTVPDGALTHTLNYHNFGNNSEVHINAGKMVINTTAGAGIEQRSATVGIGDVFVHAAGTLGGSGVLAGNVFALEAGARIAPGNSVGNLTVGGLLIDSSSGAVNLDIEGNAAVANVIDRITLGLPNTFVIGGGVTNVNLTDLGGTYTAGDYVLIDYSGDALDDTFVHNSFAVTGALGVSQGMTAGVYNDAANTNVVLRLTAGGPAQWAFDTDGNWSDAAKWTPAIVPNGADKTASFLGNILQDRTVTLDGSKQVSELHFDNAHAYTIAQGSGTLTVGNGTTGMIDVQNGSHVISANLALSGAVNKTGPGTLTISGVQSNVAGSKLAVKQGVVNLNSNAGGGTAATSNLELSIVGLGDGSGARVNLGSAQSLKSLTVAYNDPGTQTLNLNSPILAGASSFNGVNVFAGDASALAAAKAALWDAICNANILNIAPGVPNPHPQDGIYDSNLHASSGVGLAFVADAINGDHLFIRSTRIGDLNLDGATTIADFIALASHFNQPGTWNEGDLNYDHQVTIADFIALASNFNQNYSGSGGGAASPEDMQLLSSFASSIGVDPSVIGSAVPEPTTISVLALGAVGLLGRRRRKA